MPRYIDADALEDSLIERYCDICKGACCALCRAGYIFQEIKSAPAADVEPVRHEKWEVTTLDGLPGHRPISFFCSGCLLLETRRTPFCSYCGAKMDKGVDDGT